MNIWYNYQEIMSYNAIMNFIIGERGVGKTYGAIKFVVNRFLKNKEEFVYLRRYKTELKESVPKFFEKINENNEFKNKLESKNNKFYCDSKIIGYAFPLSIANILKSTTFSKVKWIIFDEFIIDKGCYHYLQNEVHQLLDIIETIGRLRDIRILFLGNAISTINPYFTYFELTLPYKSNIKTFKDGLILVNYIKNEKYREVKKNSRFGKLISGTEYEKYAIDNEFVKDNKNFVLKKSKTAKFIYTLIINNNNYGVWCDYNNSLLFISKDYDPLCPIKFAFNTDDHNDKTILIRFKTSPFLKMIIEHYKIGKLYFDSLKIKTNVFESIKRFLM